MKTDNHGPNILPVIFAILPKSTERPRPRHESKEVANSKMSDSCVSHCTRLLRAGTPPHLLTTKPLTSPYRRRCASERPSAAQPPPSCLHEQHRRCLTLRLQAQTQPSRPPRTAARDPDDADDSTGPIPWSPGPHAANRPSIPAGLDGMTCSSSFDGPIVRDAA